MGFLLRESKSTYKKKSENFQLRPCILLKRIFGPYFNQSQIPLNFVICQWLKFSGILLYESMPMGKLEVLGLSKYIHLRPLKRLLGTLWFRIFIFSDFVRPTRLIWHYMTVHENTYMLINFQGFCPTYLQGCLDFKVIWHLRVDSKECFELSGFVLESQNLWK